MLKSQGAAVRKAFPSIETFESMLVLNCPSCKRASLHRWADGHDITLSVACKVLYQHDNRTQNAMIDTASPILGQSKESAGMSIQCGQNLLCVPL